MPVVSVIIPNYNTAHFLVEAIDSVYTSTSLEFEVIVVDDGSIDNSAEVVAPYLMLPNFKLIMQSNKGLAGARNTGIMASKGKYLVFLDSDDIILPNKLSLQVNTLELNPEYDAVYSSSIFFIDGKTGNKLKTNFPSYSGDILKHLLYGNFIHVNSIMVRKEAVVKVGLFDEALRELEDWDLWLRMSLNGSFFFHQDQILSEVRLRKGSMTSNQMKMNATMVKVLEKNLPSLVKLYSKDKTMMKNAKQALLQYKLLAKQTTTYNQELIQSISDLGLTFLPVAFKLFVKRISYGLFPVENKTTKRLEQVWNG